MPSWLTVPGPAIPSCCWDIGHRWIFLLSEIVVKTAGNYCKCSDGAISKLPLSIWTLSKVSNSYLQTHLHETQLHTNSLHPTYVIMYIYMYLSNLPLSDLSLSVYLYQTFLSFFKLTSIKLSWFPSDIFASCFVLFDTTHICTSPSLSNLSSWHVLL